MTVTKIAPVAKNRSEVYVDEQFAFVLYKGELSRYHIEVNAKLDEETYKEIVSKVILNRAKAWALHLLNVMGRSEGQLRIKLVQGGFTQDIVEEAIAYVKSFGYINDMEYARSFIDGRKGRKSRKELYAALCRKGIAREEVEQALEEYYDEEDSRDAIEAILRKKKFDPETADYAQRQKIGGYLMRKGFRYDEIRHVLQMNELF